MHSEHLINNRNSRLDDTLNCSEDSTVVEVLSVFSGEKRPVRQKYGQEKEKLNEVMKKYDLMEMLLITRKNALQSKKRMRKIALPQVSWRRLVLSLVNI